MSQTKAKSLASLDIGTTKVVLAVAQQIGTEWNVVSIAQMAHKGFHQGQIIDAKDIINAVRKVKTEVELVAGFAIESVYVSFADVSLEKIFSKGTIAVKKVVTERDVDAVKAAALESAQIRSDREVLHTEHQQFRVENLRFEDAPIGHKAHSLEVTLNILTVSKRSALIVRECLQACGLAVENIIPQCYATSQSVTTLEQRRQGVALVDIGGMSTDIVAYKNGKVVMAKSLPVGGVNFTQDLAIALKTPQTFAEKIKKAHGAALVDIVSSESIPIESIKSEPQRFVDTHFICEVLEARSEETLSFILKTLNDEDLLFNLTEGILITGGGSQLPGLSELGEFTFDIPLKRGTYSGSINVSSVTHQCGLMTSLGLLNYALACHSLETVEFSIQTFKSRWDKLKNMIDNIL